MKVSAPRFSRRLVNGANGSCSWLRAVAVVASIGACSDTPATSTPTAGTSTPTSGTGGAAGSQATAGTAAAGGTATFAAVLAILADSKNNCGLCHKMPTLGGGLIFDPSDKMGTYIALVGVASKGMQGSMCAGKTYVVAGKPDESLLYDKVSKATPSCGVRMPASGVVLEDNEIATIRAWIMAGGPNN
jgi:hypothetical protein